MCTRILLLVSDLPLYYQHVIKKSEQETKWIWESCIHGNLEMRQSILESAPVRLACRSPTRKTCQSRANTMGGLSSCLLAGWSPCPGLCLSLESRIKCEWKNRVSSQEGFGLRIKPKSFVLFDCTILWSEIITVLLRRSCAAPEFPKLILLVTAFIFIFSS